MATAREKKHRTTACGDDDDARLREAQPERLVLGPQEAQPEPRVHQQPTRQLIPLLGLGGRALERARALRLDRRARVRLARAQLLEL